LLLELVGLEGWLLGYIFGFVFLQVWAFSNEVSSFLAVEATFLFLSGALVIAASAQEPLVLLSKILQLVGEHSHLLNDLRVFFRIFRCRFFFRL